MRCFQEEWYDIKAKYESDEFCLESERIYWVLKNKPVILYGAGTLGIDIAHVLRSCGISPVCFCDKKKTGIEENSKLPIINPDVLLSNQDHQDSYILITSFTYGKEIKSDLIKMDILEDHTISHSDLGFLLFSLYTYNENIKFNIEDCRLFFRVMFNLNKMVTGKYNDALLGYESTYNLVADNKSKQVITNALKLGLPGIIREQDAPHHQYFDESLILPLLSDDEVFVDAGAFVGDTAEIFFRHVKNQYSHYYAFEPDDNNYLKSLDYFMDKPNTTLVKKGVYSKTMQIGFNSNYAASSSINAGGGGDILLMSPHLTIILIKVNINRHLLKWTLKVLNLELLKVPKV